MARPIRVSEDTYEAVLRDVLESLKKSKSVDGVFKYAVDMKKLDGRTTKLSFTPLAYMKMLELVHGYATEVGWQGTMERTDDGFLVSDVFVYPQEVTGAQVLTDDGEYAEWLQSLPDETFNHLRFHGHSHVNFAVTPSSTDLRDREGILSQLNGDDFYAFLIINKRHEVSCAIFDMRENVLYDTQDVTLAVEGAEDLFGFKKSTEKLVRAKSNFVSKENGGAKTASNDKKKKTTKKKARDNWDDEDEDSFYDGQYSWLADVYPGYGASCADPAKDRSQK